MLRKVVLGSGLVALVPTLKAASPVEPSPVSSGPLQPPPMRPSDLPIYESPHADYAEYLESQVEKKPSYIRSVIQEPIRLVRENMQSVLAQTDAITQTVRDNFNEFQDRTDWIVKYLREEENKDIRYGAVGMGGVTGFIFGLRGGMIRRVFYAGIGTTLMGFVCFPEDSAAIARQNGALAKQYINIAYNFCYGVKPGDPQLELKLPELSIPKNFNEFVDLTSSVATSVKQIVSPPPAKDDQEKKD